MDNKKIKLLIIGCILGLIWFMLPLSKNDKHSNQDANESSLIINSLIQHSAEQKRMFLELREHIPNQRYVEVLNSFVEIFPTFSGETDQDLYSDATLFNSFSNQLEDFSRSMMFLSPDMEAYEKTVDSLVNVNKIISLVKELEENKKWRENRSSERSK